MLYILSCLEYYNPKVSLIFYMCKLYMKKCMKKCCFSVYFKYKM